MFFVVAGEGGGAMGEGRWRGGLSWRDRGGDGEGVGEREKGQIR